MQEHLALIGFGEAASTFARAGGWESRARSFDVATSRAAAMSEAGVRPCASADDAVAGAPLILSLVTADQALAAARQCASAITKGAIWCDMNSVAPDTKRAAAAVIEDAGGCYVDVAVLAPVDPARLEVPLLLAGKKAADAAALLLGLGFGRLRWVGEEVGHASAIKMIRSVMVKGIEALTAECVLAARKAGVLDDVLASLDAGPPASDWPDRADYNLDRMMAHGLRRAAEMEEVVKTLEALGTGSAMTRGTVERQRAIGALNLSPPAGLAAKLALLDRKARPA